MTVINHWGKYIDPEVPNTGVISQNEIAWEYLNDEICPTCEKWTKDIEEMQDCPECEELLDEEGFCPECGWNKEKEFDYMECSDHEKLIGDWVLDTKTGLYDVSKREDAEFAAIISDSTFNVIQVVWSKYTTKGTPCSPCFPGQISIGKDETGDFLAYDLPEWLKYKEEE